MGSFLNCIADRIFKQINLLDKRSHCDYCGHTLMVGDLLPLLSYLILKGRCRYCGNKIANKYFISELLLGIIFIFFFLNFNNLNLILIKDLGLICLLYGLSLCDLNNYEIPNGFIICGILWWLIFSIKDTNLFKIYDSILGAFVISFFLFILNKMMFIFINKESLGGGDIKLFFLTGLYLGFLLNFLNLLIACFIGIIIMLTRKKSLIPFGPVIAIATFICLLYGDHILKYYLFL